MIKIQGTHKTCQLKSCGKQFPRNKVSPISTWFSKKYCNTECREAQKILRSAMVRERKRLQDAKRRKSDYVHPKADYDGKRTLKIGKLLAMKLF